MSKVKAALAAVYAYFIDNPGAVTLVLGWLAAGLAHFGFHASAQELFEILVILVPAFAGAHLVARRGRAKTAARAAEADKPAAPEEPAQV